LVKLFNYDKEIIKNITHLYLDFGSNGYDYYEILPQIFGIMNSLKYVECIMDKENYRDDLDYKCFSINNLPSNIKVFEIFTPYDLNVNTLPINIKFLHIASYSFSANLDYLPISLEILIINSMYFNNSLDNLPSTLKILILIFNCYFDKPINNLPENLEYLCLISSSNSSRWKLNYKQSITNLPPKLKRFYLDDNIYNDNKAYLDSLNINLIIHNQTVDKIDSNIIFSKMNLFT
jgi:hypothetical protein